MLKLEELVGQLLNEKYLIKSQLGQGGMGAVYFATHIGTERPVAVKVIAPQFMNNNEFVERFRLEARAAGKLRHPNIVNVTDFGFTQVLGSRIAYLVMEYLNGCSLGDMLKDSKQMQLSFVVDIVEQVCLAIEAAHEIGIIHRDLKPDNIWLEPNGRGGYNVKVLDFGLAKLRDNQTTEKNKLLSKNLLPVSSYNSKVPIDLEAPTGVMTIQTAIQSPTTPTTPNESEDEADTAVMKAEKTIPNASSDTVGGNLTRVGTLLGTPLYMSPEQCQALDLDNRSDIYSLAVIVYQMLTGETPFQGNMFELMAKHQSLAPLSICEKRQDLPKQVGEVVMSALSKKPVERPVSAKVFAGLLRARSEGVWVAVRQAMGLYSNYFPTFIKLSIFINIYPALFGIIFGAISNNPGLLAVFLSASVLVGKAVFAIVHENLRVLPFQPLTPKEVIDELAREWGIDLELNWKGSYKLYSHIRTIRKEARKTLNITGRSVIQSRPKKFRNIQLFFFLLTLLGAVITGLAAFGAVTLLGKIFVAILFFTKIISMTAFALSLYVFHSLMLPLSGMTYSILYFKERQALGETIQEGFDPKIADIALLK
jgi:serine/threonine protein kinase